MEKRKGGSLFRFYILSKYIYIYVSLIRRKTSPIFLSSFFRLFTRAAE